jgi:hypothetical protein
MCAHHAGEALPRPTLVHKAPEHLTGRGRRKLPWLFAQFSLHRSGVLWNLKSFPLEEKPLLLTKEWNPLYFGNWTSKGYRCGPRNQVDHMNLARRSGEKPPEKRCSQQTSDLYPLPPTSFFYQGTQLVSGIFWNGTPHCIHCPPPIHTACTSSLSTSVMGLILWR